MLNISQQIQTGWNTQQKHPLPEAEVVPVGKSSNEKKKLERVTSRFSTLKEYDNIPLPGFTLFASNRKSWGSLDNTWLVIDPRGFLVRISNNNLEEILQVTGITEGLIQERCVWARNDTQTKMTLVPVSSPVYVDAVKNTQLIEEKVNIKDVQIGDRVILQNTLQGIYMGIVSLYGPLNHNYSKDIQYKPQIFTRRQVIEFEPGKYYYQSDLKILKVLEKSTMPMEKEESVTYMNTNLASGGYFTNSPTTNLHGLTVVGNISYVSSSAVKEVPLTYEEITIIEAEKLFDSAQEDKDVGILLLEGLGSHYLVDFPFLTGHLSTSSAFYISEVKLYTDNRIEMEGPRRYSRAGDKTFSLDKFTKFYKIVKNVKGNTYI